MHFYENFSATNFGEQLSGQIRYAKYKPPFITNNGWHELLGDDVNNLTHMRYTATEIAQPFSENEQFDRDLVNDLYMVAQVHDQAESITGDISYGDKTASDGRDEMKVFLDNIDNFNPDLSEADRLHLIDVVQESLGEAMDNDLAKAFNTIERIGYIETGMRAYHILSKEPRRLNRLVNNAEELTELRSGLSWLAADVLLHQIPHLTEQARSYDSVDLLLQSLAPLITAAFNDRELNLAFSRYGDEKRLARFEAYNEAREVWTNYSSKTQTKDTSVTA